MPDRVTVHMTHMIQDPLTARTQGIRPADGFLCDLERNYWDGPVSDRLAVLDFDPETGDLRPPAKYLGIPKRRKRALFDVPKKPDASQIYSPEFIQLSVAATVLRTMKLFEGRYRIGRELAWRNGPQLLIIPRAGEWANAFYDRETNSLNFFFFRSPRDPQEVVFTSLSRDIVVHEATHAILDGIAPDLLDAVTPESLAIHEAVADFVAMLIAFESKYLVEAVLSETRGGIEDSTAFCSIAPEFGEALDPDGRSKALRDLLNTRCIGDSDVPITEPHRLSQVLSGALYSVLMLSHAEHRQRYSKEQPAKGKPDPWYSCSGGALKSAGFRIGNTALRALDYLPPGELCFADYGRAMLGVDEAGRLNPPHVRRWLRTEFLLRRMVEDVEELEVQTNFPWPVLNDLDIERLLEDDGVALRFANQHRRFLGIPPDAILETPVRYQTCKTYYGADRSQSEVEECLFKVPWFEEEADPTLSIMRRVKRGVTLSINLTERRIVPDEGPLQENRFCRLLLHSDRSEIQHRRRDAMIRRLMADGLLKLDEEGLAPDGAPLGMAVIGRTTGGALELNGAARLLHIAD